MRNKPMTTPTFTPATTTPTVDATRARALVPARLVGGIGGLIFVASVVVQNALRAGFPANDATARDVTAYYAGHRGVTVVLAALFPLGAIGLATFLGALGSRVAHGEGRAPALAGLFGAAGVLATFTMLVATDVALAGYVHRGASEASVVEGMWVLHSAVFAVLLASIGIALAGLSAASAVSGLLPDWWKAAGLIGGLLLLGACASAPSMVDAGPGLFVGLIGFLVWLVFVTWTSIVLLRRRDS
jgi:hypothetical protein